MLQSGSSRVWNICQRALHGFVFLLSCLTVIGCTDPLIICSVTQSSVVDKNVSVKPLDRTSVVSRSFILGLLMRLIDICYDRLTPWESGQRWRACIQLPKGEERWHSSFIWGECSLISRTTIHDRKLDGTLPKKQTNKQTNLSNWFPTNLPRRWINYVLLRLRILQCYW